MKKLLTQVKRIFGSLRKFFSVMTGRATHGTGIAVKTVGGIIGAGAAFLVLVVLLVVIGLVAIPYGAFAATKDIPTPEEVMAEANGIVDAEFSEAHCESCGVVEDSRLSLQEQDGKTLCPDCLKPKEEPDAKTSVDKAEKLSQDSP